MLFTPKRSLQQDGSILSTHPPPYIPGTYSLSQNPSSLAALCLSVLLDFPDQVHLLPVRLFLRNPSLVHDLVPDPANIHPKLWGTIIQVYDGLPSYFASQTLPLADIHIPLLQSIPSTPSFSLLTLLFLPACSQLTDDTVVQLKFLHTLAAFDASNTSISSYAITSLAATLQIEEDNPPREHRGPWQIRVLSLRNCKKITNDAFPSFVKFPLLSVLDLRGTRCRPDSSIPFKPCDEEAFYYPSSLETAISALYDIQSKLFSSDNPFILNINTLYHRPTKRSLVNVVAPQDAFVVIPSSNSNKSQIKVGNVNLLEKQIKAEEDAISHERNKAAWYERQERIESRASFFDEPFSVDATRLSEPILRSPKHRPTLPERNGNDKSTRSYVTSLPLPPIHRRSTTAIHNRPHTNTTNLFDANIINPLNITNSFSASTTFRPNAPGLGEPERRSIRHLSSAGSTTVPRGAEVSAWRSRHGGEIGSSTSTSAASSRIPQPSAASRRPANSAVSASRNLTSSNTHLVGETNSRSGTLLFPRSATGATPTERFYQSAPSGAQRSSASVSTTSGSSRLRNNSLKPNPAQAANTSRRIAERAVTDLPAPDASLRLYRSPPPWSVLHDAVAQSKSEKANRAWMASSGGTSSLRTSNVGVLNLSKMEKAKRDMEEMILETTRAKRRKVGHALGDRDAPAPFVLGDLTKTLTASRNPFRRRTVSDPPIHPDASIAESMDSEPDFSRLGQEDSEDEIQNDDRFDPFPTPAGGGATTMRKKPDTKSENLPTLGSNTTSSTPTSSKSKLKPREIEEETPSSNNSRSVKKLIPILSLEPPIFTEEILRTAAENERKAFGLPMNDNNGKKKVVKPKSKSTTATIASARRKSTGSSMTTSKANPFDWKSWGKST